jgi:predicted ATPase
VTESILSQYTYFTTSGDFKYLRDYYESIVFYRNWEFGKLSSIRQPQKADLPSEFLLESFSNLGMVLSNILSIPKVRKEFIKRLSLLAKGVYDIQIKVEASTVQILLYEESLLEPIPASRFSDGTLRFIVLLSILLNPKPPKVVCIEEPELGLHPDLISVVGELLKEYHDQKKGIILITTHSDILIISPTHPSVWLFAKNMRARPN